MSLGAHKGMGLAAFSHAVKRLSVVFIDGRGEVARAELMPQMYFQVPIYAYKLEEK